MAGGCRRRTSAPRGQSGSPPLVRGFLWLSRGAEGIGGLAPYAVASTWIGGKVKGREEPPTGSRLLLPRIPRSAGCLVVFEH